MAEFGRLETLTLEAAADLSAFQYMAVRVSALNKCNVASDATASSVIGILQDKPASGRFATVGYLGLSKATAGGAVTAGDRITFNGSGRIATVASGQMCIGQSLETSTADGQIIGVLLQPTVRWAGAP